MLAIVLSLAVGYLLGSVPFGLLLTRAAGLGDVRKIGSGSIGATNVLRTGNKKIALATVLLDGLKGTAAVVIGWWIGSHFAAPEYATTLAGSNPEFVTRAVFAMHTIATCGLVGGLGAFLGHIFPVWLAFKGGKGVATYIGVLLAASWHAAAVFAVAWLATAYLTRYSSLSALVATFVVFVFLFFTGGPFMASIAAIISALLYWRHRENIHRLMEGTESKIGAKA
ncbi:MAG: glycerol-3-phosphate 1-O-acyltransferase PlsY [Proteobacteria bacterium]|nr:glycerol-3-phosphate 1-O-acyltransferase PlsY [Pseudomonadota bacterium]